MVRYKNIILFLFLPILSIILISCASSKTSQVNDSKTIYVISFNDFHGMLYERCSDEDSISGTTYFKSSIENKSSSTSDAPNATEVPGAVNLVNSLLTEVNNLNGNAIIVSGGDNYQGTIVSYDTKGLPVNEFFKLLKLKASAVGNHEFDWGQEYFDKWQHEGDFVFLAANVLSEDTKETATFFKPYIVAEIDGVKIAFVGLATTDTRTTTSAKNLKGLEIIDSWVVAQKWIDFLKEGKDPQGKPDVIIALTHIPTSQDADGKILGEEMNLLIEKTNGLDAVFSGHSHLKVCGTINDVPVIQAQCYGKMYGVFKIKLDSATNKLISIEPCVYEVKYNQNILPENKTAEILAKYSEVEKKYSKVLGKTPGVPYNPMELSSLGVYMSELMAKATDSQIAMVNPFGIRTGLDPGNITVEDMFRISPFNNTLVTMKVTGEQLQKIMEYGLSGKVGCIQFYGLSVVYDSSKPVSDRIISMSLPGGETIENDKTYTLCVNDFMFTGGDGFKFDGAKDTKVHSDIFVRDLMIKDIEERKDLKLPPATQLQDLSKSETLKEAA